MAILLVVMDSRSLKRRRSFKIFLDHIRSDAIGVFVLSIVYIRDIEMALNDRPVSAYSDNNKQRTGINSQPVTLPPRRTSLTETYKLTGLLFFVDLHHIFRYLAAPQNPSSFPTSSLIVLTSGVRGNSMWTIDRQAETSCLEHAVTYRCGKAQDRSRASQPPHMDGRGGMGAAETISATVMITTAK